PQLTESPSSSSGRGLKAASVTPLATPLSQTMSLNRQCLATKSCGGTGSPFIRRQYDDQPIAKGGCTSAYELTACELCSILPSGYVRQYDSRTSTLGKK